MRSIETLSTPCFVVREKKMDTLLGELLSSCSEFWPNTVIGYSFKTNSLPWIICHMKEKGLFAEVVSDDEYALALCLGYRPCQIIFNGPVKSRPMFEKALMDGSVVNIDSHREVRWACELQNFSTEQLSVGIRVNFDIESMCPGESVSGREGGRFGFCYENGELSKTIKTLVDHGINIKGLHLHVSSKTRSRGIYRAISSLACEIACKYELKLTYIDIGGGFFGGMPNKPQFFDYLHDMADILARMFDQSTALILEPGMSLIGASVDYVTKVVDVKETTYGRFVVIDGGRTHIDPLMTKHSYTYHVVDCIDSSVSATTRDNQTIVGFTCMEHDRLMSIQNQKVLHEGDMVVFEKVGAYTMSLNPQFIHYLPSVYLDNGEQAVLIRKKNSADDYLRINIE